MGMQPNDEISEFRKEFADFRAREFADLRLLVQTAFGRMDRLEDRVAALETRMDKNAAGAEKWLNYFFAAGGGSIFILILNHLLLLVARK